MKTHYYVLQRKTTGEFISKNDDEVSSLQKALYFDTEKYAMHCLEMYRGGNAKRYKLRQVNVTLSLENE